MISLVWRINQRLRKKKTWDRFLEDQIGAGVKLEVTGFPSLPVSIRVLIVQTKDGSHPQC